MAAADADSAEDADSQNSGRGTDTAGSSAYS